MNKLQSSVSNGGKDGEDYERFHIDSKPAQHVFKVPHKFDVHAKRLRLARMLIHESIQYKFKRDVVLSRPCIYGVFSGRLGGFKPIKQRCVGCMRCVQEYPHIMTVNYSDGYKELGDSHWTPESVFTILYESSTGKIPVKGMGYKGRFGGEGWDGIWTDMSEIVRPTRDGVFGREYISTSVDIGRRPLFLDFTSDTSENIRIIRSPLPIILETCKSAGDNVRLAIRQAASNLNIYHMSEHPLQGYEQDTMYVPIINEHNLANFDLANARVVEVDFRESSLDFLARLRDLFPSKVISARLALNDSTDEDASRLVQEGVEVLHLYADHHGFDYSNSPRHVSQALSRVHKRLVDDGVRDTTTIIASGGITLAEHVPKAIICGADLVGLDTTLLVALQSEFKGETRDREHRGLVAGNFDVDWGCQRIINLMGSWHDQLIEILSAMGMRDVRRLRGDVGRSMNDSELREQAFEGIAKQS